MVAANDTRTILLMGSGGPANEEFYGSFRRAFLSRHPRLSRQVRWVSLAPSSTAEQYASNVRQAVKQRIDLIVARNGYQAQIAHRTAPGHALLFWSHVDPRKLGLLPDAPGKTGMATGLWVNDDMDLKRLELLLDAYPSLVRVGLLVDEAWQQALGASIDPLTALARERGVVLDVVHAASLATARSLIERPDLRDIQAWCLPRTTLTADGQLASHLAAIGRPVVAAHTPDIHLGAHLSYAHDRGLVHPALVDLAARILQGEPAGSIPIQKPHRYQLAVRLSTDPRLPPLNPAVIKRADLVVRP